MCVKTKNDMVLIFMKNEPIVNSGCIVLFNKLFAKKEPMVDTISTIGSLFFSRKALYVEGFFFLQ